MQHDVFVSFSFEDQEKATYIVNTLTAKYGISCWICTRDLRGGDYYKDLIPDAIDAAKVVVFIQSSNAVESKEIPKEIGMAFDADKTIIPFRLDEAKLKGKLRYDLYGIEYIDATKPTLEQRIHELALAVTKAIGKPPADDCAGSEEFALVSGKIVCHEIFAGRDDLLEAIDEAFAKRDVVFLHGMGGIGKSELACQYWRKHRDFYTTVVFARYENSLASLIADDKVFNIPGMARRTKADNTQQTDEEYALDKLKFIKQTADVHTLIILDNYDVAADPFFEELESDANYRILVTTRQEPERGKHFVLPVRELDDDALREIFIEYANPEKTLIEPEDPAFPELFELTSRHTLTLELIAKYMDEKDIDEIGEMVQLLKRRKLEALSDSEKKDGFGVIRKIFRMASLSEQEKNFMRCLAMMPPAGVNQKMFKKWCGDLFGARSRLVDLSLVRINSENRTIALHPIIREVVLSELKAEYANCREFVDRCTMIGEQYIVFMWQLPYEEKQRYFECYNGILKAVGEITDEVFEVYMHIAYMYNLVGDYSATMELQEKIYRFSCERYGESSEQAIQIMDFMGWKNANCYYIDRALTCYEKVAAWYLEHINDIPEGQKRKKHTCLQPYGELFVLRYKQTHDMQDIETAKKYFALFEETGKYLMIDAQSEDEHRTNYHLECIHRAYFKLYYEIQEYALAEKALERFGKAIREYMNHVGDSAEVDMASWYHNWAKLRIANGDYSGAISALKTSCALYVKYFSKKNTRIIEVLEELAECCREQKNYAEAASCITQALEIAEAIYTEEHPVRMRLNEMKRSNSELLKQ